jgi:peptide/nickel transport system substrate-binding protein
VTVFAREKETAMTEQTKQPAFTLTRRQALKATAAFGAGAIVYTGHSSLLRAAQAVPGGQIIVGKPYELTGNDPQVDENETSWEIFACVYESLLQLDDNLAPQPLLAQSWTNPDPTTYVITLRQGVKFHNGREMTSDDVAFSLNRLIDPATVSWWGYKMGPATPPPAVGAGTPTPPPGIGLTISATGPYEITAKLTASYAPFLSTLAGIPAAILPAQEIEAGTLDPSKEMLGTGPYKVTSHSQDQQWVLDKHTDYWDTGKPYADQLIWNVMTDESARVAGLRNGEIQISPFENPKMLDLLKSESKVTTVEQVTTNYYILFINSKSPELTDVRVRQAISAGISRDQIRDLALFGRGTVTGPIAAGFSSLATPIEQVPFFTQNVDQAKQLLSDAGADNLKLQLLVTPVLATTIPMAELIKSELKDIGVEIEIVQKDLSTFVQDYAIDGTSQLAISWWAGYSDPYLILSSLASTSFAPILGMGDPTIDDLLTKSATETDPETRLQTLRQLEAAIATDAHFVPLVTRDNFVAYRNDQLGDVGFLAAEGFGLPFWHRIQEMYRIQ